MNSLTQASPIHRMLNPGNLNGAAFDKNKAVKKKKITGKVFFFFLINITGKV